MQRRTLLRVFPAALTAVAAAALSPALQAQGKRPVLRITGKVKPPGEFSFDMAAFKALPARSFTTSTPWDPKPLKFSGPLLRDVLDLVGAHGQLLKASALNDYTSDIPADDARRFDVIVAHSLDDKPIPVRARGPLFIIYPFDDKPELRAQRYFARSVWQLKAIEVV